MITQRKHARHSETPHKYRAGQRERDDDFGEYLWKTRPDKNQYQTLVQGLGIPQSNIDQLLKSHKRKG